MKSRTVELYDKQDEFLRAYALRHGCSVSEFVRTALDVIIQREMTRHGRRHFENATERLKAYEKKESVSD